MAIWRAKDGSRQTVFVALFVCLFVCFYEIPDCINKWVSVPCVLSWDGGAGCLGLRQSPAPDARRLQLGSMGLPFFSHGSVRPSLGDIVSHPKSLTSVGSAKIGRGKEFLVP